MTAIPGYRFYILMLLLVILFAGCLKVGEYYTGLHMQPDMDGVKFEPGLNIFGVVKCGSSLDSANHYFEVQKILNLNKSDDTTIQIFDAEINLHRQATTDTQFSYLPQLAADSLYIDRQIEVTPGDQWIFTCTHDSFYVSATCVVPQQPQLQSEVQLNEHSLSLSLLPDSTAFLYQIYVIENGNFDIMQYVPTPGKPVGIEFPLSWQPSTGNGQVYIFAYDKNFRVYNTTSNTFFKPNTYRPSFSTVNGGYGVFGAVSSTLVNY
ncbi:MAG: hypothetical protein PF436_05750 [Prolixibacteraceae bacterium]|nr:hypothetical protein [Prolixibacteraceae bacterium]